MTDTPVFPDYPLPPTFVVGVVAAILFQRPRSFRRDAQTCIARLNPPLRVEGREHIPRSGPCLLTINHYMRPGFATWWLTFSVSAVIPAEVHWTMTAAWTFPGQWYRRVARPISEWILRRLAQVYRFTSMPPMPPDPAEAEARAKAVRQVLAYAKRTPQPIIGLSPEGRDFPGGVLGWPPPGAGRFIQLLVRQGLDVVPIGVYEQDGTLCVNFGPRYRPEIPAGLPPDVCDRTMSQIVMEHIAAQLPERLRGEFNHTA